MTLPVFDKHKEYPKIKTGGIQMAQAKYDREIKELVVQRILNGETTTANMARPFLRKYNYKPLSASVHSPVPAGQPSVVVPRTSRFLS